MRFGGCAFDEILTLGQDAEKKDIIINYYAHYVHTNAITCPLTRSEYIHTCRHSGIAFDLDILFGLGIAFCISIAFWFRYYF